MSQSKGRRWRQTAPKRLAGIELNHLQACWLRWLRGCPLAKLETVQVAALGGLKSLIEQTGFFVIRSYSNFTVVELYHDERPDEDAFAVPHLDGIGVTKRCGVHIEWRPFKDCAPRPMLAVPGVYTGTFSKERIGDEHNTAQAEQIACSAAIYDAFDRAIEGGA